MKHVYSTSFFCSTQKDCVFFNRAPVVVKDWPIEKTSNTLLSY